MNPSIVTNFFQIECGTRIFARGQIHGGTEILRGEYPWYVQFQFL